MGLKDDSDRAQLLTSIYVIPGQPEADAINAQRQAEFYHVSLHHQALWQRSAWTRDDLLSDGDLRQYDQRLLSEWALRPDQVCDELGEGAGEAEMASAGRAILKWAESPRVFRSCPLITPKVARSSLQMLAIARAMAALCARAGRPWPSPGTNSPQDCLCPGSAWTGRLSSALLGHARKTLRL